MEYNSTMRLSDQIRKAIRESGLSQYRICQRTGIDKSMFSKFVRGKILLGLANIDKIAKVLKLRIVKGKDEREKR